MYNLQPTINQFDLQNNGNFTVAEGQNNGKNNINLAGASYVANGHLIAKWTKEVCVVHPSL